MNSITHELLDKACPSIRYRMHSEILGEASDSPGMKQIQTEILEDAWVQKVFLWQQADGWIGRDFHGENRMETWSPFSGLMLETDWKNSDRRIYDLTFRSLLIIHYFNKYL